VHCQVELGCACIANRCIFTDATTNATCVAATDATSRYTLHALDKVAKGLPTLRGARAQMSSRVNVNCSRAALVPPLNSLKGAGQEHVTSGRGAAHVTSVPGRQHKLSALVCNEVLDCTEATCQRVAPFWRRGQHAKQAAAAISISIVKTRLTTEVTKEGYTMVEFTSPSCATAMRVGQTVQCGP
jgi:hypothetical protein